MTCQELRLYFEDPLRPEAEFRVEPEHLVHCAECARFVDTQRRLGTGLRHLRNAVPQVPQQLDMSVLANYRRDVMNRPSNPTAVSARHRFANLRMTGAVAVMVLVAGLALFLRPRAVSPISGTRRPELNPMSQSVGVSPTASVTPAKVRNSHRARRRCSKLTASAPDISLWPGFRSLMYCDELSCGGVMELIRVQLPSSGIEPGSASAPANAPVIAEVLVGRDGIARGIRIVQ
jgi:hypothetical protein